MTIRYSSSGGTPFGDTASRPSTPQVGQTYYNGQLGYLEIYTVSGWIPATGANDFSLNITGTNTVVTFSQTYSSGSYSIVSFLNDSTLDIYAYATDGSLAGYTNTKAFTATQRFNKMVILGGSYGDVLQFSYKTTYATSASTTDVTAGPYITSITPSGMPNKDNTITITGGNFATNVAVAFTGTGYTSTPAKSIVRSSSTSLIVTRPDNFPVSGAPYTVTVTNPSIANQPIGSAVHQYSGITAGVVPVWQTSANLGTVYYAVPASIQVTATDADGSSSITYSIASGSLPAGLTLNSSTGVISGTHTVSASTYSFTLRATDSGGNYTDLVHSLTTAYSTVTGGTLTSDATYYYRAFTGNGTLSVTGGINTDLLLVAGGGGGGYDVGSGGGAGGLILKSSYNIPNGTYPITIGSGGPGSIDSSTSGATRSGQNSTFGSLLTALGGGGSGSYNGQAAASGGSGGGGLGGQNTASQAGGQALQSSSQWGGYGYPGGTGVGSSGVNNYSGAAGGGGAGGAGKDGTTSWTTAGDTVYGAGGVGLQVTWITANYGDPANIGWFAGGGGGSTDTPTSSPYLGWGYGGKGGGGDGANRTINNGTGTGGYYYIDGKPNTGSGGGGGGSTGAAGYPGNSGNNGGPGGSGICVIRYARTLVGG